MDLIRREFTGFAAFMRATGWAVEQEELGPTNHAATTAAYPIGEALPRLFMRGLS